LFDKILANETKKNIVNTMRLYTALFISNDDVNCRQKHHHICHLFEVAGKRRKKMREGKYRKGKCRRGKPRIFLKISVKIPNCFVIIGHSF
jgi:hypothetical protein